MSRVFFASLLGLLIGVICVAWLIPASVAVVRRLESSPEMRVEHWVYYISVIVGGAAGAVCGAVAGATAAGVRALRERHQSHA
jgi:hypothetical protein